MQNIKASLAGIIAGIVSILTFGLIVVFSSKNPHGDPHVGWAIQIIFCILLAITNTVTMVISYLIHRILKAWIYSRYIAMVLIFGISFLCITVFSLALAFLQAGWHQENFILAIGAFFVGLISETVHVTVYKRLNTA
jgi:MFS family permease